MLPFHYSSVMVFEHTIVTRAHLHFITPEFDIAVFYFTMSYLN